MFSVTNLKVMIMKTYNVVWEIEIDADSPEEAAKEALAVQRDRFSDAVYFTVTDENDQEHGIDLM